MKLTAEQIKGLLKNREDERVEFKRAASELPDNLWETYSAFCNTDGGTAIAVQKRGSVSERFSGGLDHEYRVQIGLETWGDNNARGDIKVDNKVDNNARGDIKVDNKVDNKMDPYNHLVRLGSTPKDGKNEKRFEKRLKAVYALR